MTTTPNNPPPPPYYPYPYLIPRQRRTNGLAVAALVLGIVWLYGLGSVLAIIFGGVAMNQCTRDPDGYSGKGMAVAGLVLGILGLGLMMVLILVAATAPTTHVTTTTYNPYR
jgi:hypothetical protein